MDIELKNMMAELKNTMLEKFDEVNNKIDTVDENLNKKIDAVSENLDKKINYVDEKQTENFKSLSDKLDYTNNNVALILQEQVKMREEMKKYNELNEKQHRLFEYEINNLKRYVV